MNSNSRALGTSGRRSTQRISKSTGRNTMTHTITQQPMRDYLSEQQIATQTTKHTNSTRGSCISSTTTSTCRRLIMRQECVRVLKVCVVRILQT